MARINRRILSSFVVAVLMLALSTVTLAAGNVLDFENYETSGGEWEVRFASGSPEVIQNRPSGQTAWFLFQGDTVPEAFVFEAEFGVISGNNIDERPYFGLLFNQQLADRSGGRVPGYRFDFRPSQFQYELVKVETGGTALLASHTDVMPWLWGLEEWRTLRVVRNGSLIEAYVNDELLIRHTDQSWTGGYVGVWTYSTAAVFKNFKFTVLE